MHRHFAALTLFAAVFLTSSTAFCGEPQVYYSRHFTLWYYSEQDFTELESLFREGPLKGISGYGPETDYLGGKIEEMYSAALSRLGVADGGRRFLIVLLERSEANRDLYNLRGISRTDGDVRYDHYSGAIYVYPERAGLGRIARELVNAIMAADGLIPAASDTRYLVSVPLADDICAGFDWRQFLR